MQSCFNKEDEQIEGEGEEVAVEKIKGTKRKQFDPEDRNANPNNPECKGKKLARGLSQHM
jgi:hypothetical protein